MFSEYSSISALSCSFEFVWVVVVGGIPRNYLVSTQLQFGLFCCWGCGCCWAVTISSKFRLINSFQTVIQTKRDQLVWIQAGLTQFRQNFTLQFWGILSYNRTDLISHVPLNNYTLNLDLISVWFLILMEQNGLFLGLG